MVSRKLASALKKAQSLGRGGDTMLAHINPREADLLKKAGGSGTVNPHTGLPEFMAEDDSSYGGGGYGYGQSNYGSNGGGDTSGGWSTGYSSGGGGGYTTSTPTYRSAAAIDAATNNYGGGGYGVGQSSGPTPNSSSGASQYGGSWNSPSTYSGGTSVSNSSPSRSQPSAASSLGSALSAGAGMAQNALSSIGSGLTSFSDSLNGILSNAQPTVTGYGNQVANTLGAASDSLNNGIATGYGYAKDFITKALDQGNTPSYTQYASGGVGAPGSDYAMPNMGPPGLRSEAANGGYDAPSSFPSMVPSIDPGPGMDMNSYIGGSRLGGYEGSGNTVYSGFGKSDMAAEGATPAYNASVNPDVSYALRFNPGTISNAEYIKGSQIKDQFPNVDFGGLSNTDVGKIVTRTIAGEAAGEGQLGQQLVGSNIMNRLTLANQGIGLAGNFGPYASFRDVMRGYDANGFDKGRTQANSVYNNPGETTEQNAFNAMSAVLSPNAAINKARTNPVSAMELGAQYGVSPEAIANAVQSTHYYDPRSANPKWGPQMANAAQIGNHLFGSLDTSPKTWGVVNGVMTGFNIPNPGSQVASNAPVYSPPSAPAPSADPNAQVEGGSGNYLGQVGTDFAHSYQLDTGSLVADIKQTVPGASWLSDSAIMERVAQAAPEGVSIDPKTGTLSIGDVNKDGTVDAKDRNAVVETFKGATGIDPSRYAVAVAPPAPQMDGNVGTQFAQPARPVTPTPQFAYSTPADAPAPDAQVADATPPQYIPNHPITPTPQWAYNTPVGVNPNGYAEPLTLPAQPTPGVATAVNTLFSLIPGVGLLNSGMSLFGNGIGDMYANRANIPMTPEEAQAAENRLYAQGEGKGSRGSPLTFASSAPVQQPTSNVLQSVKAQATLANMDWQRAALAHGYSQAQLSDPKVAALIKQIYEMGLIPKIA